MWECALRLWAGANSRSCLWPWPSQLGRAVWSTRRGQPSSSGPARVFPRPAGSVAIPSQLKRFANTPRVVRDRSCLTALKPFVAVRTSTALLLTRRQLEATVSSNAIGSCVNPRPPILMFEAHNASWASERPAARNGVAETRLLAASIEILQPQER